GALARPAHPTDRDGGQPLWLALTPFPGRPDPLHFLGLDLGTSALKALLVDERQAIVGSAGVPLVTLRPAPLASEQDPAAWWQAVEQSLAALQAEHPAAMADVAAIGLSGQMHAALLLGRDDRPLRPAMLWNDGRAHGEALELRRLAPNLPERLGV